MTIKDRLLIEKIKSCGEWVKSQGDIVFSGAAYVNLDYYIYKGDEYIIYQVFSRGNIGIIELISEEVKKNEKI